MERLLWGVAHLQGSCFQRAIRLLWVLPACRGLAFRVVLWRDDYGGANLEGSCFQTVIMEYYGVLLWRHCLGVANLPGVRF